MAKRLALVLMQPRLRGRKHKAAGLDGARLQQSVPMSLAGLASKSRRNRQEYCAAFRKRPVERGKPQVVANRQADPAPGQVGNDRGLARLVIGALAIALAAGQVDVEHVDLVVACE